LEQLLVTDFEDQRSADRKTVHDRLQDIGDVSRGPRFEPLKPGQLKFARANLGEPARKATITGV